MFAKVYLLLIALTLLHLVASQAPTSFSVTAVAPGSPIHNKKIEALDQQFVIGAQPVTICPFPGQCPGNGETAFWLTSNSGLDLAVEVPGGQQVYVQTNGAVGFTQPHSTLTPPGSVLTGFSIRNNRLLFAGFGATHFVACPVSSTKYQIFANVAGGNWKKCISFRAETHPFPYEFATWEFA